jgi:glycosyltransferase involved in cell wall biosynthesis
VFTAWGTLLYVDTDSGLLAHGPVQSRPANAVLAASESWNGPGSKAHFAFGAGNSRKPMIVRADRQLSVGTEPSAADHSTTSFFDVVPLERGLFALRHGDVFLKAVPDGKIKLDAGPCSTWDLFLASEPWCTDCADSPDGEAGWRADARAFDRKSIESYIVHPLIRARSEVKSKGPRILIFGNTKWSHGRIYYDLCKHLHRRGYIADILDWRENHSEYIRDLIPSYDLFMTALDGADVLVDKYDIPYEKIVAISHHEFDIRTLVEAKGLEVFDKFANYGVVGESVYCTSLMRGISRIPMIASLAVEYSDFEARISERLATVGYACSMSAKAYGIGWKRGELAEAAARGASLDFKVAGWAEGQVSFHDMPSFYRSVDAVVVSSISELGSLPVIEAAAAGRLVIGTPIGHFPLKAYQGGGILAPVEAKKFVEFTTSTLLFYKNNPRAYVEKCAAIQLAAQRFDWKNSIEEWIELIEAARS